MLKRNLLPVLCLLLAIAAQAQNNFTYSPDKPKPGDVITFTYTPAGDIDNTILPVEGIVYQTGRKARKVDDLILEKNGGKYTGSFMADTAMNFVYFVFNSNKKIDNNYDDGYYILLQENDKPAKGAYASQGLFYQFLGRQNAGTSTNNEKALAAFNKEFELNPDSRRANLFSYIRVQTALKKEDAPKIYQKEIESLLKGTLKEEADYQTLGSLYQMALLPEQAKLISTVMKDRFPNGAWVVGEAIGKLSSERDPQKKKELFKELEAKTLSGDVKWKSFKDQLAFQRSQVLNAYIHAGKWEDLRNVITELGMPNKMDLAGIYNSAAWAMQQKSEKLEIAEEFARLATSYAKENAKTPLGKRPEFLAQKQWQKNNEATYAMYADTYGMVMYRMGNHKKGLPFAKEAAITINKGNVAEINNTYALLAEKTLPRKQYVKEIEQFIKDGKSTGEMKEILKRAYVKNKKSESGFDDYIVALQKESYLKMLEDLRKSMLDETASPFALVDLNGKKVQSADLRGKVVVVDFWATWCGPCKASFPGMQKMVTKYKDDPNVKFIFIDTWERGEGKEKNAAEFLATNKYSFHVLMDNDDKVVAEFKVEGIPTKFVLDKNGRIRFKSIGFDGSDDKLINELTAMIEIAGKEEKKAF